MKKLEEKEKLKQIFNLMADKAIEFLEFKKDEKLRSANIRNDDISALIQLYNVISENKEPPLSKIEETLKKVISERGLIWSEYG